MWKYALVMQKKMQKYARNMHHASLMNSSLKRVIRVVEIGNSVPQGEFDGFPGRRDRPNHAHQLASESRVLPGRIPAISLRRRKAHLSTSSKQFISWPQAKSPEKTKPAQNHLPEAPAIVHFKDPTERATHNRIEIYHFRSIENQETRWPAPEDFDIDSVFQKCNRNWKQHQNPQNHSNQVSRWRS